MFLNRKRDKRKRKRTRNKNKQDSQMKKKKNETTHETKESLLVILMKIGAGFLCSLVFIVLFFSVFRVASQQRPIKGQPVMNARMNALMNEMNEINERQERNEMKERNERQERNYVSGKEWDGMACNMIEKQGKCDKMEMCIWVSLQRE